jgi:hypothetical protein
MNCQEVKLRLEAFHDGCADSDLSSRIGKHIAGCAVCNEDLRQLQALSTILRKSSVPAPSAALAQGLIEAFHQEYKQSTTALPWWKRAFGSTITIPVPALAIAIIVIVIGIAAANIVGRNAAIFDGSNSTSAASTPVISLSSAPPEIVEQTKIVEVPVIRERIVTRVVHVERQGRTAVLPARNQALGSSRKDLRRNSSNSIPKDTTPAMNDSIAENGYLTRIDLTGFQPTNGMNARVVREGKNDEK